MKKLEYFVFEYDLTRTIEVSILSQNKSFARFSKISPTFFGIYWCILTFRLGFIVFFCSHKVMKAFLDEFIMKIMIFKKKKGRRLIQQTLGYW